MTTTTQSKTLSFGKIAYTGKAKTNLVEIEIALKNKETAIDYETLQPLTNVPEFTASAHIWDSKHYDHVIGGQCLDEIKELFPNNENIARIHAIWGKYHLSGLNAGTKKQCDAIDSWREKTGLKGWQYQNECDYLKSIDLYIDNGIAWGNQWLYRPIPADVIAEIQSLMA